MAQAAHRGSFTQTVGFLMNTDGRAHPRENTLASITLVLGLVAAITAHFPGLHLTSSWTGLAGLVVGVISQLVSATTGQRALTVLGLGGAGVGLYLGMSNGGLFGGWLG
ncbi:hypothetical protein RM844_12385 [Streptomyces sp. DSM 44915]|uniref:Integral membrane protein n=1 Tax=Streptomyces chisholmiae TaxID=3075540 RepID=A0ABU2JQS2_9ACTN|nr:hypothetical protein [Streptomyces sp. DSM 44915]MDT0267088.1 hypothetical protein [Streptomyces sp. DSM 44915]